MIKKTCIFCKKEFFVHEYRKITANFCSKKCYNNYRKNLTYPEKTCPKCNKNFSIKRETRHKKYCSAECANLAKRKYEPRDKICEKCGKTIKYSSKNPKQKFCSVLCQIDSRAYHVNENFFRNINSEGKAYVLGLIFSDGSISSKKFYTNISSTDRSILEICKKLLNADTPIHHYKNCFSLIIGNRGIHKSLIALGVLQRKSWKEYSLPAVSPNFMRHFLRGFFDGDGSFFIDRREKNNYLCASFACNSKTFLEEVKSCLLKNNIEPQIIRYDKKDNNTGSWQLRIAKKNSVKNFTDFLYKNSKYFLNRKYNIVKKFYGEK